MTTLHAGLTRTVAAELRKTFRAADVEWLDGPPREMLGVAAANVEVPTDWCDALTDWLEERGIEWEVV